MRVVVGADDRSAMVERVVEDLRAAGHEVEVLPVGEWVAIGRRVGERVANGAADVGIVGCWTGTGVSIAANKVPGVRAALCGDAVTAIGARRWNDANVLALSLRATSSAVAGEIVGAFLGT
ncbi:MAG TPA: RpiB/LacA/LacB family sugar-phosphate isomerase, partial [Microthrixaceae bacterium]|nr:RpiB/LacA/LacB family sugar-phosphate isomerase [Microthrixaceae bacterium]